MSTDQINQFAEKYKTLSNAALLAIIANAGDYQPGAVETAQNELNERRLTEDELAEARFENERLLHKEQELTEVGNKVRNWGSNLTGAIDPFGMRGLPADRIVKRVSIILTIIFVYDVYARFGLLKCLLFDGICRWSIGICSVMLPIIVLPVSIILFWLRKKAGWVLLTAFLICRVLTTAYMFYDEMEIESSGIFRTVTIQNLFFSYIGVIVLYSLLLLVICKKDIREQYTVNGNTWAIMLLIVLAFLGLQRIY